MTDARVSFWGTSSSLMVDPSVPLLVDDNADPITSWVGVNRFGEFSRRGQRCTVELLEPSLFGHSGEQRLQRLIGEIVKTCGSTVLGLGRFMAVVGGRVVRR